MYTKTKRKKSTERICPHQPASAVTSMWPFLFHPYPVHFSPLVNYFKANPHIFLKDIFFKEKISYSSLPQVLPLPADRLPSWFSVPLPSCSKCKQVCAWCVWHYHLALSLAGFPEPCPPSVYPIALKPALYGDRDQAAVAWQATPLQWDI